MDNANDKIELQIDNLMRELESKREDSQCAVKILGEIMTLDALGIYSFKYLEIFKELMDSLEENSIEIINLWTKTNLTVQIKYDNLLEKVINAAEMYPEKYGELLLKTCYRE